MFILLVAVQALFAGSASATTWTWTGLVGDGKWSSGGNWVLPNGGTGVPVSGAPDGTNIVFDSAGGTTSTMDIDDGLSVDTITFASGASNKTINGENGKTLRLKPGLNSFVMASGVTNVTLGASLPVVVEGPGTVNFSVPTGPLTINSVIGGTANMNLFGGASSTVTVNGSLATSGNVGVASGTLSLNGVLAAPNDQAVKSAQLIAGLGAMGNPAATVLMNQPFDIDNNTDVFVNAAGYFNTNGNSDDIDGLSLTDGGRVTVSGAASGLAVNGVLSMSGGLIDGGQRLRLVGGGVAATSTAAAPATIGTPVVLPSDGVFFQVTDGPQEEDLVITQPLSGGSPAAAAAIDKGSSGRMALKQPSANTYDGQLSVRTGQVRLAGTSGLAVPSGERVFVGNGFGDAGTAAVEVVQSNAISNTSPVDVLSDGVLSLSTSQSVASLNVAGGRVTGTGSTIAPLVSGSAGGVIESDLVASQATTVSAGDGGLTVANIKPSGGFTGGFAKTGAGTLTQTGAGILAGTTDVQTGTFVENGTQVAPVQVASGATLAGSGAVGATTVAGTLAPGAPALTTGDLTFAPTGKLAIAGPPSDALPRVNAMGTVSIDPAAQLDLQLGATPIAPGGTQLPFVVNDGSDPIAGRFANASDGTVFTGASGQTFIAGFGLGDGNDVGVTAVAPVVPGPGPGPVGPAADTRKPTLTFTVAKKQKLSKKGTFAVKLKCDEACTVTLATSVKPPGKKSKTGKASKTIKLAAGKSVTVNVALPKTSLTAVRKAVKAQEERVGQPVRHSE